MLPGNLKVPTKTKEIIKQNKITRRVLIDREIELGRKNKEKLAKKHPHILSNTAPKKVFQKDIAKMKNDNILAGIFGGAVIGSFAATIGLAGPVLGLLVGAVGIVTGYKIATANKPMF